MEVRAAVVVSFIVVSTQAMHGRNVNGSVIGTLNAPVNRLACDWRTCIVVGDRILVPVVVG